MDWTAIGALAGVALGWVLNELSQFIRYRREDIRDLAEAVSPLVSLYSEMRRLSLLTAGFKNISDRTEQFETFRQYAAGRYPLSSEEFEASLDRAVNVASHFDAGLSYDMRRAIEAYRFFRTMKLSGLAKSEQGYELMYANVTKAYSAMVTLLRDCLLRLSQYQGILPWIRMKRLLNRKLDEEREAQNEVIDVLLESFADIASPEDS